MEEKKIFVIAIGIIIIMLIGVIAAEDIIPTIGDSFFNRIISEINYLLKGNTFTVYGSDMSCSSNPDNVILMINHLSPTVQLPTSYSFSGTQSYYADYFRGQPGNDQFISEFYYNAKDGYTYVTYGNNAGKKYLNGNIPCDAGAFWNNKCYIQIYNCAQGACNSNADCSNSLICSKDLSLSKLFPELGVCRPAQIPTYTTKVYTCNSNGTATYLKDVSYGDKYFSIDSTKNAYIKTDGTVVFYILASAACQVQVQGGTSQVTGLQKGISKGDISSATTPTLIQSVCTKSEQCEANSSCESLTSLVNDKSISDIQAKEIAQKISDTLGSAISTVGGGITAIGFGAACVALAPPTAGISLPICLGVGAGTYLASSLGLNNFFNTLSQKNLNDTGLCVKQENSFFSQFAFFSITGDKNTDGMIIIFGGIVLILFLLLMMIGGRK